VLFVCFFGKRLAVRFLIVVTGRGAGFSLLPLEKVAVNAAQRREQTDEVFAREAAVSCEIYFSGYSAKK
jgi:hypothetical protein